MRDGECGIADSGGHNIRMCNCICMDLYMHAQVPDQVNKLNKKCQNQPLYCGCVCVRFWKRVNFTRSMFFCAFRANKYCLFVQFFICTENELYEPEQWWFFIRVFLLLQIQFLSLLFRFLVLFPVLRFWSAVVALCFLSTTHFFSFRMNNNEN